MKLSNANSDIHIPDNSPPNSALPRTTHLCIAAHADDIEIMAFAGISHCFDSEIDWFTGVVVTDGAGSPRRGKYLQYTKEELIQTRIKEQREAAGIGKYSAVIQLGYSSSDAISEKAEAVSSDLEQILLHCKPKTVYLHNLADRHDTHIAVAIRALNALRLLPNEDKPDQVLGVEVWRDLDWLGDKYKVVLNVSEAQELHTKLLQVFKSQTASKRYDLAVHGRNLANATYQNAYSEDQMQAATIAMDLTPLIQNKQLDYARYTNELIDEFKQSVSTAINMLKK